jgi:hypothetical protein
MILKEAEENRRKNEHPKLQQQGLLEEEKVEEPKRELEPDEEEKMKK